MKSFITKLAILLIPILCGIGFFSINVIEEESNICLTTVSDVFDEFENPVNENVFRARSGSSLRVENDEDIDDCSLASHNFYSIYLDIRDSYRKISLSTNRQYYFTRILPKRAGPIFV